MKHKFTMQLFVLTISGLLAGEKLALRHGDDLYILSFIGVSLVGLLTTLAEHPC